VGSFDGLGKRLPSRRAEPFETSKLQLHAGTFLANGADYCSAVSCDRACCTAGRTIPFKRLGPVFTYVDLLAIKELSAVVRGLDPI
jgi:hypothetical protein